ncbi:MAG: hypothetical protein RL310_367 [Actinomycetota bacterium]
MQVLSKSIVKKLTKKGLTLSVAESVTAGGLASELTNIAGSSKVFKGGVIAYSDESKISQLDVKTADIKRFTSVSEQVALEMANNVRKKNNNLYVALFFVILLIFVWLS